MVPNLLHSIPCTFLAGGSNNSKALKSLNKARPWLIVATPGRLKKIMDIPGSIKRVLPHAQRPHMYEGTSAMTIVLEEVMHLCLVAGLLSLSVCASVHEVVVFANLHRVFLPGQY